MAMPLLTCTSTSLTMNSWLLGLGAILFFISIRKLFEDKSTKPNISWLGWVLNLLLRPLFLLKPADVFKPLDLDILKQKATEKSGLSDFGDWDERPYREAIQVINSYNYSPLGRYLMYRNFVNRLVVVLKIQSVLKENISLKEYSDKNPIRRPCFILGMPRTGTTFLHQLLALDPNVRAPMMYELDYPVPLIPEDLVKDKETRIQKTEISLERARLLVPHLIQSHELSATMYDECCRVLCNDVPIRAQMFMFRDKETTDLPLGWDFEKAYRNYYKVLQILEYYHLKTNPNEVKAKRWVLKSPVHLGFISDLIKVFPDADILWCHRDVASNYLSTCILFRAVMDLFLDKVQLKQIALAYFSYSNTMFRRAGDALQKNPNISCIHVKYNEFTPNPIQMIQSIYDQLGYKFTDEYRTILEEYLANDKVKRKELRKNDTRIPLTLEYLGTSHDQIDRELGWYSRKYL